MPYKDEKKRKEYQKKWYSENREKEIKSALGRKWKHVNKMKEFVLADKLSKGCAKCDEKEPCCLDYHHTGDDKEVAIATALNQGWGKVRMQKEIDKCILVCANCHRKIHAGLIET